MVGLKRRHPGAGRFEARAAHRECRRRGLDRAAEPDDAGAAPWRGR